MTKKVLINFDDLRSLMASLFVEYSLIESHLYDWFNAQQDASNLEKIILAYEQATDISPEELNIRDEE